MWRGLNCFSICNVPTIVTLLGNLLGNTNTLITLFVFMCFFVQLRHFKSNFLLAHCFRDIGISRYILPAAAFAHFVILLLLPPDKTRP